ncbi:hypothetical protein LXL04_038889 [Taraxacum kok-saghyz]
MEESAEEHPAEEWRSPQKNEQSAEVCRCRLRKTNQETHKPVEYTKNKNQGSNQVYLQRNVDRSVESRRKNICVKLANMLRCQRIGCNASIPVN